MTGTQKYEFSPATAHEPSQLTIYHRRGDVAVINLADPERWVLEQVLPGVGGRTLGGAGHSDIVRCAYLDTKVRARPVVVEAPALMPLSVLRLRSLVALPADFERRHGWRRRPDLCVVDVKVLYIACVRSAVWRDMRRCPDGPSRCP
jgi:hypothetical protein